MNTIRIDGISMNSMDRQWFFRGFRKQLLQKLSPDLADKIWADAGEVYDFILKEQPELKKHKGAMVLPCVALFRSLTKHGLNADKLLNEYGDLMGKRFSRIIHGLTSVPGADRLIWNHAEHLTNTMSSEEKGYKRRLVSEPPDMYGVDILSCPYHELAKELGEEKAVLCICHMDKEYSQGFRHIRYDRNSAVSEGAECCEYRLRFDPDKK